MRLICKRSGRGTAPKQGFLFVKITNLKSGDDWGGEKEKQKGVPVGWMGGKKGGSNKTAVREASSRVGPEVNKKIWTRGKVGR